MKLWVGLAILANGVLDFIGIALRQQFVAPASPAADAFSRWAAAGTFVPAYLIIIVGTAVGTLGYVGLYRVIGGRLAYAGALLAAFGYQFLLALLGVLMTFHAFAASAPAGPAV